MEECFMHKEFAEIRQQETDEHMCEEIVDRMSGDGPRRVLLAGESGIGKTRLARMISKHATIHGYCYLTICLHLNTMFEDELSLYENIAFQIDVYDKDEGGKQADDLVKALKEKITAELNRKRTSAEKEMRFRKNREWTGKRVKKLEEERDMSSGEMPYILLILDDEDSKTSEDRVMKDLGLESFLKDYSPLKIIITKSKGYGNTTVSHEDTNPYTKYESQDTEREGEMESPATEDLQDTITEEKTESQSAATEVLQDTITEEKTESQSATTEGLQDTIIEEKIESHTMNETHVLLDTICASNSCDLFLSSTSSIMDFLDSPQRAWRIDGFIADVVEKSLDLPAAIVVLAKSLNFIIRHNTYRGFYPKQEKVLVEVLSRREPVSRCNPIFQLAYQLLETHDTLKDVVVDCFWHSLEFFMHCGCVHYGELITQWILEGYFDPVRSVDKAFNDGYTVFVELLQRGILKRQEGDMVVPEMAMNNLIDLRRHGLSGRSRLRFARVYGGHRKKGLGKITQIDDMIRTVQATKRDDIYTIMVSGNRLRREIPHKFFKRIAGIEVLVLFDPTLECLTEHLSVLGKLRVLVIRNCDLLSDIKELRSLKGLNVLEVSGASSVETICDDFFVLMSELQSLNLSGLRIKHSPSSISKLKLLHSLILRDCPLLEDLPDIQELKELEVFDVRGAHNLKTCFGKRSDARSNQDFSHLRQLQLLDFSESKIKRLPMFHSASVADKLHSLTCLSLQNCSNLIKLPNLKPLSGLQILDLSGTTSLVDIAAVCFEQKEELKILNLSGTKFTKLPSTISELPNLCQLLLRNSSNLEAIANVEGLKSLEVFDVSGCTKLQKIEGSFKDMSYLREVNLSGTKIETLPEFPSTTTGVSNLSQLLLRDISHLEALPNIEGLTNLEVFDVSGCIKLQKIEGSFKNMSYLREVNLSGTRIETLPELPEESSILCSKLFVQADSTRWIHDSWSRVKEAITDGMPTSLSSSDTVGEIQEISRKEPGRGEKQLSEPWAFDSHEKKGARSGQFFKGHIYRDIYMNTIPFVDTKSCQEVVEIQGSNDVDQDKERLARAEFVVFVDNDAESISSIYSYLNSMKGCWLEMCGDIDILFFDVDGERLGELETLSITNLLLLKSICSSSFKNLKKLSMDCCPRIEILFPASALPISLEILKIRFCGKLKKVFEEELELPNLHTLCLFELPELTTIGAKLPNLETLSIKNLSLLDNICSSSSSFKHLKKLNLDCCPSIITLFPASHEPTSLEVLEIKFCDKLEKVFAEEFELPHLHTLCVLELPVLSPIGATLPNLVTYKEDKCPKLKIFTEESQKRD